MGARASALADRFEQANREVVTTIEGCSDEQLRAYCPGEQCTVVALTCHVGEVHESVAGWVRTLAMGQPLPEITMEMVDRHNAARAAENANRSKAEALDVLRRNGAEAARLARGLSDEELDRSAPFALFGGTPITTEAMVERILIGDPLAHLPSIKAAIGQATSS